MSGVNSRERLPRFSVMNTTIAITHFAIFIGIVVLLVSVQPSPLDTMGYFSFEKLAPFAFWMMLFALVTTSVLSIESNHSLVFPAIVVTMLAMRLPLFLMFRLPYNPDSYVYMGFIREWHAAGTIDLSVDQRAQFWPVFFVLLYAIRELGVSELVLWSLGTLVAYSINALLLYLVLRRFGNDKTAKYALLLVSLAPTLNFYYYQIMAPQLLASTIFLGALLALFAYERQPSNGRLALFIGLFALLLLSHHATSLLLTGYVFMLLLEAPLAKMLERLRIISFVSRKSTDFRRKLVPLGIGMGLGWIGYLTFIAQEFTGRFLNILIAVLTGKTSTYSSGETSGIYSIETYAFNLSSLFVYGFRLLPLVISAVILLILWVRETIGAVRSETVSLEKLRALTATLFFGSLMLVSIIVLNGLFLEVSRLFDIVVLFSSVLSATWFVSSKRLQFNPVLKGSFLLGIVIVSSTLGMAVQSSEFVYYKEEKEAVLFLSVNYPTATLYTDERLLGFAKFFGPNIDVRAIPPDLNLMLQNRTLVPIIVLMSYHSIAYNRYRPLFGHPPLEVIQFILNNGEMIYSNSGITVYHLG